MLPSNKIGRAVVEYGGGRLEIEASFTKLKKLQDDSGMDAIVAVGLLMKNSVGLTQLFHTFQVPHVDSNGKVATYTEEQIHDCFFGNLELVQDQKHQQMIANAVHVIMGMEYKVEESPAKAAKKKPAPTA